MGRLDKVYYCGLALAVLFALWGVTRWLRARTYTPPAPVMAAANRYSFQKPAAAVPLSRYARLRTGELFFGPAPRATLLPRPSQPVFSSKLLLYGVSKGANVKLDRAVVGLVGDSERRTWMVRVGSVVGNETVVRIEEKGIWVRNATGKGKVELRR